MPDMSASSASSPGSARRRPPILAGAVSDYGGAWPAYLLGAAWGAVLTIALLRTPEAEIFGPRQRDGTGRVRFRAHDALPRASDYISSIMLIAIPGHCAIHGHHVDAQYDLQALSR
jgi:hypothetical protein